ncbi:hypothetical protein AB1E18_009358 [Capra hircus]
MCLGRPGAERRRGEEEEAAAAAAEEEEAREEEEEEVVEKSPKPGGEPKCIKGAAAGAGGQGRGGRAGGGSRREAWGTERRGGSAGGERRAAAPTPARTRARTHSLARSPARPAVPGPGSAKRRLQIAINAAAGPRWRSAPAARGTGRRARRGPRSSRRFGGPARRGPRLHLAAAGVLGAADGGRAPSPRRARSAAPSPAALPAPPRARRPPSLALPARPTAHAAPLAAAPAPPSHPPGAAIGRCRAVNPAPPPRGRPAPSARAQQQLPAARAAAHGGSPPGRLSSRSAPPCAWARRLLILQAEALPGARWPAERGPEPRGWAAGSRERQSGHPETGFGRLRAAERSVAAGFRPARRRRHLPTLFAPWFGAGNRLGFGVQQRSLEIDVPQGAPVDPRKDTSMDRHVAGRTPPPPLQTRREEQGFGGSALATSTNAEIRG